MVAVKEGEQEGAPRPLLREDSTEATIAMLLTEAAASVKKTTPAQNNVPSSADLDVRNSLSVRYVLTL